LNAVTWGNDQFAAVSASGQVLTSPSGTEWTVRTTGAAVDLQGIAYGNGSFVAVGLHLDSAAEPGVVLVSNDAVSWVKQEATFAGALSTVYYGEGLFVAAGTAGTAALSRDGSLWALQGVPAGAGLRGVASAEGQY